MIFDLNSTPAGDIHAGYDVCIAGAGFAGICLALELAERGHRVLLLEAGGLEYSEESQQLYTGDNVGRPYYALDAARLRFLGGTSNHWGGGCRPLDTWDFEPHEHIPHSGWPIRKTDIARYLRPASKFLEIDQDFEEDQVLADSRNTFAQFRYHNSIPPVHPGEKYLEELSAHDRIHLFINANLVDIQLTEGLQRVHKFVCANYAEPSRQDFSAKVFVLAMGGIENARALLNFRSQIPAGIGNTHDLVGRFFMEHLGVLGGFYVVNQETEWRFQTDDALRVGVTTSFLDTHKTANTSINIGPQFIPDTPFEQVKQAAVCTSDTIREFLESIQDIWCPTHVYSGGCLYVESEQTPNPNSRVLLSDKTDRFGLRKCALDWQAQDIDRHTIKQTILEFGRYLALQKYGNVKLIHWLQDDDTEIPGVGEDEWQGARFHHMGTTRMGASAKDGVVDANCKMFGLENLYIAGSSVFRTGGHANPTLTIIQLTLRLADHLAKQQFSKI